MLQKNPRSAGSASRAGSNFRDEDNGQSLVEFALTLPVLLLVVTGISTFGIAMNNYLILTDATGVGARQIAVSRQQTSDPCATASAAVIAAAPTLKSANFTFSYTFNGVPFSGTSCTGAAVADLVQGKPAVVTVTYPCNFVAYKYNFGTCNLNAQTTEVIQ